MPTLHLAHQTEPAPAAAHGAAGWLRDADWRQDGLPGQQAAGRAQLLHRWPIAAPTRAGGLRWQPLDGNPRHGVLFLLGQGGDACHGAIELFERQGRWLVMPQSTRARLLACGLSEARSVEAPWSGSASTPDRRYVFFNRLTDGGLLTLVRAAAGEDPAADHWRADDFFAGPE